MLSLKQLHQLDQHYRQIFLDHINKPFGGSNVMLFRDFFQLLPIGSRPLFNTSRTLVIEEISGWHMYRSFNKTVELDVIMRQQGDSKEQRDFRDALHGLHTSSITREHQETLTSQVQSRLTPIEVATFDTTLYIYRKKSNVKEFNYTRL